MDNAGIEDLETIREFLVESYENLSRLDQDLVELEKHPQDANLLGSISALFIPLKVLAAFSHFRPWKESRIKPKVSLVSCARARENSLRLSYL